MMMTTTTIITIIITDVEQQHALSATYLPKIVTITKLSACSFLLCRIQAISLGQGQGPVAEKLIANATLSGDWVFLQVIFSHLCR